VADFPEVLTDFREGVWITGHETGQQPASGILFIRPIHLHQSNSLGCSFYSKGERFV